MTDFDWNVELRAIERAFDGLPPEPSPAQVRARKSAEFQARLEAQEHAVLFKACVRVILLGLLLMVALWWPRAYSCGVSLVPLIALEILVAGGALWAAAFARRNGFVLVRAVAIMQFVMAVTLLSQVVVARAWYGPDSGNAPRWSCSA